MESVNNFLVKADRFCDYIPVFSSMANLVDLFQKYVTFPCIDKATIQSNHYFKHIDEKSFARCLLLVLPFIGNIIIGIMDATENKKQANLRPEGPQDNSLNDINKLNKPNMEGLCSNIRVTNRNDYIKCMLIFAIKAERFHDGGVDMIFHDAIQHFQDKKGILKAFVHEDIAAGRANKADTLLHEILKCEFLSPKSKASAFDFILRDGHDYLRDYCGKRDTKINQYNAPVSTFTVVKWGFSLKKIFDALSETDRLAFLNSLSQISANRLNSFTGIK